MRAKRVGALKKAYLKSLLHKFGFVALILIIVAVNAFSLEIKAPPLASGVNVADIQTPIFDETPINRYGKKIVKPISLNFTNIKVRELLQIIAQFTQLNFIINDNVKGEMSVHLHQVPWTQALDVILKSQNLGERHLGDIIYIAPLPDLMQQKIAELESTRKMRDLVGLEDRIIRLRYANAEEIEKILTRNNTGNLGQALLSGRGWVNADPRTNSLWIRDTPEHVSIVVKLVRELDFPAQQVMIEARIVSVDQQYGRQLGARFGLSASPNFTGTLNGANTMAQNGGNPFSTSTTDRLNFDIPASGSLFGSSSAPGSIAVAVARLGSTFIDLELSALEAQNMISIISSPHLITSNLQKAYIQTGEEIPYSASSSSGATSVSFVNAVLKLEVTPQITPDKRVILGLTVTNNSAGSPITLSDGGSAIPINTEEEQSKVLLNNNQTVVLGGVYARDKSHNIRRIPFFGELPLIGHLFSSHQKLSEKRELLIFLTPHIISKPSDIS